MKGYCTGLLISFETIFSEQLDILEMINLDLYFPIDFNFHGQLSMIASQNFIWKAESHFFIVTQYPAILGHQQLF